MAIRETSVTKYRIVCDKCGRKGAKLSNRIQVEQRARLAGWKIGTKHLCPVCRREK